MDEYRPISILPIAAKALGHLLPSKLRKILYQSTVQPHLDYCAAARAECCKMLPHAKEWDTAYFWWRAGLSMCPYSTMTSKLGWMALANRRMLRATYTRRCLRGLSSRLMKNVLKTNEDLGLCSARHLKDLHLPSPRTCWLGSLSSLVQDRTGTVFQWLSRLHVHFTFKNSLRQYFMD